MFYSRLLYIIKKIVCYLLKICSSNSDQIEGLPNRAIGTHRADSATDKAIYVSVVTASLAVSALREQYTLAHLVYNARRSCDVTTHRQGETSFSTQVDVRLDINALNVSKLYYNLFSVN